MGKYDKRDFQIGDYWLSRRGESPAFFRTSYDEAARQTRRHSLGTDDFELAKRLLTDWYLENERGKVQSDTASLNEIFTVYRKEHGDKLRSAQTIAILLRYWEEFWGDVDVKTVKPVAKQEEFQAWLFKKGLAHNSVNRTLEIGRAAINRAWKRGLIDGAPFIHTLEPELDKPKGRPLSVEELSVLYLNAADHIRLFIILMMGTAARNEAITTLTWPQIDFEADLVALNPEGRKQTSKRRPTVRLIPSVKEALLPLDKSTPAVLMFRGEKIIKVRKGWDRAVERAELKGNVVPYSIRHTTARWLRKEGVPPWEVAGQLGHRMPGYSMSEKYAPYSPDYLEKASTALDKLVSQVVVKEAPSIPSGH